METNGHQMGAVRIRETLDIEVKQPEKSMGDLLAELSAEINEHFSLEIALVKTELKEEYSKMAKGSIFFSAAGIGAMLSLFLLSFALAWGLATVMPTGVAFLIVGLLYAVAALIFISIGRKQFEMFRPIPEKTMSTLKEDYQWLQQQMN